MFTRLKWILLLSLGLPLPGAAQSNSATTVAWDVAELGLFDLENKLRAPENNRVVIDLDNGTGRCPRAIGPGLPKEVVLRYRNAPQRRLQFHVLWHPGDSGKEQFEVLFNGKKAATSSLVDASTFDKEGVPLTIPLDHTSGSNEITIRFLRGDGLYLNQLVLSTTPTPPRPLRIELKFPSLASYAKEIKEPAVVLDDDNVRLYAPKAREKEARIIFPYLVKAYSEFYRIVGMHTRSKIVVYHFPQGNPNGWGGTSECTIWYSYENLDLASLDEWKRHRMPHVSGYIEEMGHNFVAASMATFGWEMIGFILSTHVSQTVAGNPTNSKGIEAGKKTHADRFARYRKGGNIWPKDLPPNLCDSVHAHLLRQCEAAYGATFWPDFFREIRNDRPALAAASRIGTANERRDARYRLTVDCLDRLMQGRIKPMLTESGVSLTTDVKSLKPLDRNWNRKLEK